MKIFTALLSVFVAGIMTSQSSLFHGSLEPGKYAVGIKDTVLLKENEVYHYKNYSGAKPFFVKIWYPAISNQEAPFLLYEDYLTLNKSGALRKVKTIMSRIQHKVFQQYGIRDDLDRMKTIPYGSAEKKLNTLILKTPVLAQRNLEVVQGVFPTIYYHHGLGGTAEDNSVLCEYLASHGFVVVSSNYFWPYKGLIGNSYDRKYPSSEFDGVTDVEFVFEQLSTMPMVDTSFTIFIGHSWGAQVGLYLNPVESKFFDFFLLFDSTLERYKLEDVKKKPHLKVLSDFMDTERKNMKAPTVMLSGATVYVANKKSKDGTHHVTLVPPPFGLFRSLNETPLLLATLNDRLDHNCYTSQGIIRAYHASGSKQSDEKTVIKQSKIYETVCRFSLEILTTKGFLNEENLKKYPINLENVNGNKLEINPRK